MRSSVAAVLLCVGVVVGSPLMMTPEAEKDRVTSLPGLAKMPNFDMFSGYVDVEGDKHLHYWLMMSEERSPDSAPLVLWLNGGPGCSSMIGLLRENGPFALSATDNTTLVPNRYSWNKNASMLYLESPSPVGYSYGGNLTAGDDVTAQDNYEVLVGFMRRFPMFANNEFYISGESYAGQYVPQLANKILEENEASPAVKINLKGFIVGNPSGLSTSEWEYSGYTFLAAHGLLSDEEVAEVARVCNRTQQPFNNDACAEIEDATWQSNLKGVNPYNILAPCVGNGPGEEPGCFTQRMVNAAEQDPSAVNGQTFVPCGDYTDITTYLNSAAVKAALHIPSSTFDWTPCSEHLTYNQYKPGTPDLYRKMAGKIRMLVYSGDIDSCVPFLGTRRSVELFGFTRTTKYLPWFAYDLESKSLQIAGYVEHFDGVSFATVRGAGHMVPTDKPPAALSLFQSFIYPSRETSSIVWP